MEQCTENTYSVLMSVYRKENPVYFRQSIQSMMKQTLPFSDFVLVCDGPLTRELDEIVQWAQEEMGDRLQIIRLKENKGLGYALKTGIPRCRCEVIARMDSDDISRPDRCQRQFQLLEQGDYAIVSGSLQEFVSEPGDMDRVRQLPRTSEEILKYAQKRNPFNHPCVMFRRSEVLRAGNYQDFPGFEDYYLWARMLLLGVEARNLPDTLLYMRAGTGMYKRRGGWKYVKSMLHFRLFLWKSGLSSFLDFVVCAGGQMMICLIPNRLRELFYKKFLRK